MKRFMLLALLAFAVIGVGAFGAFKLSPWPSVLLIRHAFDQDALRRNKAQEALLPTSGPVERDIAYGTGGRERLDIYRPPQGVAARSPMIVWVHGGGFVAGDKRDVTGYLRALAGEGFTSVALNYDRAPGARYPAPVGQTMAALRFLHANAGRLGLDMNAVVLAGDSAGAQIAGQTAAILSSPDYAGRMGIAPALPLSAVRGVALFCGVFDLQGFSTDGAFGGFIRTVLWSYFGTKTVSDSPEMATFSIRRHVTGAYPATFISVGNADPLASQSVALAESLTSQGVRVDALFFPETYPARLGHEYQFEIGTDDGKLAFARLNAFLNTLAR